MSERQKVAMITGISGTLGQALGRLYKERGWRVLGVTRRETLEGDFLDEAVTSKQETLEDVRALLDRDPDLILMNAGQIETEVGDDGMPLIEQMLQMNKVNYEFPAMLAIEATSRKDLDHDLDIVMVGSIADGQPSCFGPVYHSTKIAIHYFVTGVGPIANHANPRVRIRLYRPGVIFGPLSWSPTIRLNEKATKVRARRCEAAPRPEVIAKRVAKFVDSKRWVRGDREPLSFQFLKFFHGLLPNTYYKLQRLAWRKASKYADGPVPAESAPALAAAAPASGEQAPTEEAGL